MVSVSVTGIPSILLSLLSIISVIAPIKTALVSLSFIKQKYYLSDFKGLF